ncbi:MAG: short-chain dehydrogenase [Flavobacteriaceae bacterium]|nr:MAG: short-chain dehydrogenase [Flavobacteriaceae bacterium]
MKTIVITGTSRGIGLEICKLALLEGYRVIGLTRNIRPLLELNNPNLIAHSVDLSQTSTLKEALDKIFQDIPKVDCLINNAGLLVNKAFQEINLEEIQNSLAVNFLAPFLLCQTLGTKMDKTGHIVNISTMGAVQGSVKFAGLSIYGSSKAALCGLTELLAEEYKENGPRVNALALGAVQTQMLQEAFPDYYTEMSPEKMGKYILDFAIQGGTYYHGKILPLSNSTP